ncbi:cupin domain-containing protein [Enterococcus hulanensis]|uniref:cupin domain-containing protein n=1 Tax=Enterococcus TaxID=1350 RepID=UPI000B5A345B|nr:MULTISPECIES: cupin domain-containing protein [Enterococcus]MBO0410186.1 cupin domain-containing protein [Enterococcus hulanensis]OTO09092.1 hypothetical protein A5875_004663 [Enterococcus sp. 3H8_DIV0648]
MNRVGNSDSIDQQFVWKDDSGLVTREMGKSVGSEKIYTNMDIVPPLKRSTKYHSHSQQEEFFFILSGEGTLIVNEQKISVGAKDFFAKPAGIGVAHTFVNTGTEDLIILDFGTLESEDICHYPEEGVFLYKTADGQREAYKNGVYLKDWTTNPN